MPDTHFVLILEPNNGDALLLEDAFKKHKVCNPARVLRNDYELRSYLKGAGLYSNREMYPMPSLLLLDFSQPIGAINILEWLSERGFINLFPVLGIGTHSVQRPGLQLAFDLGLNGYFEKPTDLKRLAKMICEIEWVDDWKLKLPEPEVRLLVTKEEFYRMGAG